MSRRQMAGLLLAGLLLLLCVVWAMCTNRMAQELAEARQQTAAADAKSEALREEKAALEAQNKQLAAELDGFLDAAEERATLTAKLKRLSRLENCTVSHYCCEKYPHICGGGNGITASGAPVQAGVTCAVDPYFIPLGSTVYVDYGNGEICTYIAQDTGSAVSGGHIDVAVATHDEALRLGMKTATVWWEEK